MDISQKLYYREISITLRGSLMRGPRFIKIGSGAWVNFALSMESQPVVGKYACGMLIQPVAGKYAC